MLSDFTEAAHIYIACGYTDLLRGVDGLAGIGCTCFLGFTITLLGDIIAQGRLIDMNNPEFEKAAEEAKQKLSQMIDIYMEELDRETSSPDGFPINRPDRKNMGNRTLKRAVHMPRLQGRRFLKLTKGNSLASAPGRFRRSSAGCCTAAPCTMMIK